MTSDRRCIENSSQRKKNMENTKGILNKTSFGKYVDCLFDEFKRQEKYYNNHVKMSIEIKNTQ